MLKLGRIAFAALDLVAIAVQLIDLSGKGTLNLVSYFSYFTIESNLIAVFALLLTASRGEDRTPTVELIRGGAVVYMSVTSIVFTLLLSNTDVDTAIPWVNTVVHQLIPLVVLADWLLDPPRTKLSFQQGLFWLSYPMVWIIYILIRGAIVNLYPYPFLNPANGGYGSVALYSVAIFVLVTLVCAAAVGTANFARERAAATT